MRGVRMRVLVALAALAVLAAACGDDANDAAGAGASGAASTGSTGATDQGDDPGAGSLYGGETGTTGSTGATGASDADVSVSLNNYLFDPGTVRVGAGDVVAVRNGNARTPHTFTVVGEDVDLELAPLTEDTVTIDLAPGTYELICRFHEGLGMTATLKVA
ncbi:MAG TPA: cupredoxin domain-containing protein [Actinomycetota bacterium]|nr:cupredoxin domain-containing protein [Actinomycetota bacterium]